MILVCIVRIKYNFLSGIDLIGIIGKQKNYWDKGEGLIKGFDANIFLNSYILKNSEKWQNNSNSGNSNNKYVLITNIFKHSDFILAETIIGKNLMEILNASGIALLNNYDLNDD